MDHDGWLELISADVDGELDAGEHEQLSAHLGGCTSCQELHERFSSARRRARFRTTAPRDLLLDDVLAARAEEQAETVQVRRRLVRRAAVAGIAVAAAAALKKSVAEPQLGAWATAIVSLADAQSASIPDGADETGPDPAEEPIAVPAIAAKSLETTGDPMDEIEVSGPVAWDSTSRTITIGADGFGSLNREISIKVPRKLALKGIKGGLGYAASASISSSGGLSLTGLSANYSLKAAADPKQAFGTHSR